MRDLYNDTLALGGVWNFDEVGLSAEPILKLWEFGGRGLHMHGQFDAFKRDNGDMTVPVSGVSDFLGENPGSIDQRTREYIAAKQPRLMDGYNGLLRLMYHNHLRFYIEERLSTDWYDAPEWTLHRLMSDGQSLLYARCRSRAQMEQDERMTRQLGILRKYDGPGGEVVIPDNTKIIGEGAFRFRRDVTGLIVPAEVRCIEKAAFMGCANLKRVIISGKRTKLGFTSFAGVSRECVICGTEFSPAEQYCVMEGVRFRPI